MAEVKLSAESRNEFGKGAARRIRRAHKIPAVLYGHGTDPVHLTLPGHDTLLALRQANVLLSIAIDGGKDQLALPKQVQRDPIRGTIEHVDLIMVSRGEKVLVEIPLSVVGDPISEGMLMIELNTISVHAEATHIPNEIEINIEGLPIGTQITLGDLKLPAGVEVSGDPDDLVLHITNAQTQASLDADLAGGAEAVAGAGAAEAATGE